ncbi:polysaccharide biosynthesis protein [Paenibacillus antri]|uniref:Polysaccharide biosynthesis protein n=1 Tax=Paenibacillus antri TaxID=2582848 RepID=A0A5R9GK89_9BACL|nr:polysaccharide biosynthesis protein [Paenibacillus antri]TLS53363.1 polysaccharide biosynthesis protein [Paenibacillus antri]
MSGKMLLRGTLILAGAALVARVLGVVQRIPLQRLLDDAGMSTYVTSYNVYMWLLVLATAGFPSAIAKLVSEKYALGRPEEGEAIRRAANRYALVAGVGAAALVFALAPALAAVNKDPNATLAIRALAPALILFPWIAVERGYFQGRQRMGANGLSQIWEQILRVVTSIVLAYFLLELGYGIVWASAGASFGGVLGAVAAAAVMLYYGAKLRREPAPARAAAAGDGGAVVAVSAPGVPEAGLTADSAVASADASSFRSIFRAILKLSIPVSITALAVPTIYLIDSLATKPLLIAEYGDALAQEMQGWLTSRAQSLAGIPVIFAIALSQSIMPIISAAFVRRDTPEVERQTSLALRMTYLSGVPAVVVMATSAFPLNTFLFKDAEGSWVIVAMVCSVLFQVLMMISGSILLGIGRPELPMKHIAVGIVVKLALSLALAPLIGIYGVVAGTALCFAVTMALNLRSLRKLIRYEAFGRRAAPFAATVALQASIGAAVGWAVYTYVHPFGVTFWDAMLQTLLAAGTTAALYPVLLLRTGAFVAADAEGLPPKARKLWDRAAPALRKLRLVR